MQRVAPVGVERRMGEEQPARTGQWKFIAALIALTAVWLVMLVGGDGSIDQSIYRALYVGHHETLVPIARFFTALEAFDSYLASDEPLGAPEEKLFQGPVADALTHVGQIAMLRRIAGGPVKGENYYVAQIDAGRVGLEQSAPRREFD